MTKTDTIIGVTYATREDLKDIDYYGEPYEDIIRGLINDHGRLETLKGWFHLACEEKDELKAENDELKKRLAEYEEMMRSE